MNRKSSTRRIITFGTFDLFHLGHLKILERASALGDYLVVGVSSDRLNVEKKGLTPVFPLKHRLEIIGALRCVNEVFTEESLEEKASYVRQFEADILVMGDDWKGKFDGLSRLCEVHYLERTPGVSSSSLRASMEIKPPAKFTQKNYGE